LSTIVYRDRQFKIICKLNVWLQAANNSEDNSFFSKRHKFSPFEFR
jgi:hypothetical protein